MFDFPSAELRLSGGSMEQVPPFLQGFGVHFIGITGPEGKFVEPSKIGGSSVPQGLCCPFEVPNVGTNVLSATFGFPLLVSTVSGIRVVFAPVPD